MVRSLLCDYFAKENKFWSLLERWLEAKKYFNSKLSNESNTTVKKHFNERLILVEDTTACLWNEKLIDWLEMHNISRTRLYRETVESKQCTEQGSRKRKLQILTVSKNRHEYSFNSNLTTEMHVIFTNKLSVRRTNEITLHKSYSEYALLNENPWHWKTLLSALIEGID